MKKTHLLSASVLLALALQGTQANAAALADIYQQALANDPQLKAAKATYDADAEIVNQNKAAAFRPTITLAGNTTRTYSNVQDFNDYGYTVSATQPLFDINSRINVDIGEKQEQQAALVYLKAEQSLIVRVVEAYLGVLRAQNTLETNAAQERAIKRRLDQVNAQFEVGLIAVTDVQEAQASYDNARVARIRAEGSLENSYEALERLTDTSVGQVPGLRQDYPVQRPTPEVANPWTEKAVRENLDVLIATAAANVARESARGASYRKQPYIPTVELAAIQDYDEGNSSIQTGIMNKSIGINVSFSLYAGGADSSRSREAEHRLVATQETLDDTRRATIQTTRSLLRDLKTDVLSIEALKQTIKSSETALKATEEGFNVGTRNVVDVLNAEQQLYSAQRDYANARFDYVFNLFSFKQQVGSLNAEDVNALDQWLESPQQ